MKRFRTLVVYLDLDDSDAGVVTLAGQIAQLARSERVLFLHAIEHADLPADLGSKYPWLLQPLVDQVEGRLEALVQEQANAFEGIAVASRILRGAALYEVLRTVQQEEADLVVVARRDPEDNRAIRITRKSTCSVLVVPDGTSHEISRLLVPIDYSKYSAAALDVASAFAEALNLDGFDTLHTYCLPRGQSRGALLPEDKLLGDLERHFRREGQDFLDGLELRGREARLELIHSGYVGGAVAKAAREKEADLVVVGCRGRDTMTALLLGSNAEDILRCSPVPVLAVKAKGTGQKLLEALLDAHG